MLKPVFLLNDSEFKPEKCSTRELQVQSSVILELLLIASYSNFWLGTKSGNAQLICRKKSRSSKGNGSGLVNLHVPATGATATPQTAPAQSSGCAI